MSLTRKTILICEDHQIVVDGLRSILSGFPEFEVLDSVGDYLGLMQSYARHRADILLLDLNLPGKNGLDILRELRDKGPAPKVLILTMYNKKSIVRKAREAGADGFLLKNCAADELREALMNLTGSHEFFLGKGVADDRERPGQLVEDPFLQEVDLTPRELEIVHLLCEGNNVPRIAKIMHISPLTVETHKKNIFRKLGVDTTARLLRFAHENRLL